MEQKTSPPQFPSSSFSHPHTATASSSINVTQNTRNEYPRRKTIMEKQQDDMKMYYSGQDQQVSGMSLLASSRRSTSGNQVMTSSSSPTSSKMQGNVPIKPKMKPNIKTSAVVQVPASNVPQSQPAVTAGVTMEGIEMALVELLASIPMSTEDIWEGDASLFPVLFQFKESFQRLSPDATGPTTYNVLTFNLPLSHFPVGKKRFRVNRNLPTSSLINLLCSKMNIPNPERFSLYSLKGYKLNPKEPLVSYGFGPLFKTWELNVRKNPELGDDTTSEEYVSRMLIETPVVLPTDGEAVVLTFPPLVELAGLQRKTFRIQKDELLLPICELIKRLWAKLGVTSPEKFTFLALDEYSSHSMSSSSSSSSSPSPHLPQQNQQHQQSQKWFVLDHHKSLAAYGLGWRFHGWDLKVVFIDLANESEIIKCPMESYGWASIQKSTPTIKEALLIANILDKRIQELQTELTNLSEQQTSVVTSSPQQQQQQVSTHQSSQSSQSQQQQQQNAENEKMINVYKQKLADVEKLLGEMESKLVNVESELKGVGDPKHELEVLTERYNQLETRYNDLFKRATTIPAGIQSRCTLAEERLLAAQAECERYKRMYMSQKIQNDALVAYALKTSSASIKISENESEDLQKKAALEHNAILIQENNTLKENNLSLTQENVKLNERVRELQTKLDVILESLCKNPAAIAASPNVTPSTLLSSVNASSSSSSSSPVTSVTPSAISTIKTAKRTSSPSVSSFVSSSSAATTTAAAANATSSSSSSSSSSLSPPTATASVVVVSSSSSPGVSAGSPRSGIQHAKSMAGELHRIRESIRVTQKMSAKSVVSPSPLSAQSQQRMQQRAPSMATPMGQQSGAASSGAAAADLMMRHQSIPLTSSERQQLLKRINDQKETMIRTNRGSYDPRTIASQASVIYAGLSTKFSEDQYASTEGEL